jgi:RNA polymerase-binding transcription factor DksA
MEWKALIEQDKQDLEENMVQTTEKDREKPKNKRSAEEKIGRLKYHEVLTKKVFAQNERLLGELRWIRRRLERIGEAEYSVCDVEGFAVLDEVDREIVQRIREAGVPGVLPKVVAADVNLRGNFALRYYDVSRRILRMNKRLHFETGKCLFEKRGHAWALTRFAFESYDEPIEPESEVSTAGSEEGLEHEKEDF